VFVWLVAMMRVHLSRFLLNSFAECRLSFIAPGQLWTLRPIIRRFSAFHCGNWLFIVAKVMISWSPLALYVRNYGQVCNFNNVSKARDVIRLDKSARRAWDLNVPTWKCAGFNRNCMSPTDLQNFWINLVCEKVPEMSKSYYQRCEVTN